MSQRPTGQHLSNRDTGWVAKARKTGDDSEKNFADRLREHLDPKMYVVEEKPSKLIVYPGGRGIILDAKIYNKKTGLSLYVEKKAGNKGGNAHERVYKFLSGPLREVVREKYKTVESTFFFAFSGETFQRDKYKNELALNLRDENYAIVDLDWQNMAQIAAQIREIV
jgi:hypothetical protein